jgi:hypothetical protein
MALVKAITKHAITRRETSKLLRVAANLTRERFVVKKKLCIAVGVRCFVWCL